MEAVENSTGLDDVTVAPAPSPYYPVILLDGGWEQPADGPAVARSPLPAALNATLLDGVPAAGAKAARGTLRLAVRRGMEGRSFVVCMRAEARAGTAAAAGWWQRCARAWRSPCSGSPAPARPFSSMADCARAYACVLMRAFNGPYPSLLERIVSESARTDRI